MSCDDFLKYAPQHPLPNEIRKMKRDETICKYCGVSYLIHSEIKALEDRLKTAEAELKLYKGCLEREDSLKEDVTRLSASLESYKQTLNDRDQLVASLSAEMQTKKEVIVDLKSAKQTLEEKLVESVNENEKNKETLAKCQVLLPTLKRALVHFGSDANKLKAAVGEAKIQYTNDMNVFAETQLKIVDAVSSEVRNLKSENSELRKETSRLGNIEETARERAESLTSLSQKISEYEKSIGDLRSNSSRQVQEISELKTCLENEKASARLASVEAQQYKQQLSSKNKDLEHLITHKQHVEKNMETSVLVLQDKLRYKETECKELQLECDKLKRESRQKTEQQNEMEAEIRRKTTASYTEVHGLKGALEKSQNELQALKTERQNMIITHQNQIEQLRQSFKQKMFEAQHFQEKVDEALRNDRSKHALEMSAQGEKLKADFTTEMQIAIQRHQELTDKYMKNARDAETKFKSQLGQIQSGHRSELADVQRQLNETNSRHKENDDRLRMEIDSLKAIIKDLENRLARLGSGNDDVVVELRQESRDKDDKLIGAKKQIGELEKKIGDLKEQIGLLQDTVRRECEERFELMEALSTAKEELLTLKRPSGGYQNITPRSTSSHPEPRRHSLNSLNLSTNNSASSRGVAPSIKEAFTANPAMIGAEEPVAKVTTNRGELRGSSVVESRKRIAAAIGRR